MLAKLLWTCVCLFVALSNFPQTPFSASGEPAPSKRYIVDFLGKNPVLQPSEIVSSIDWRYRRQIDGDRMETYRNFAYYSTKFEIIGLQLTIKCTDLKLNRSVEAHCPGLHYLVKIFGIRLIFFTLGVLAAAVGTSKMAFSRKFEARRREVLRQIPLGRRDTAMSGFDSLRIESKANVANVTSMLLYDTRETGQVEEVLKQRDTDAMSMDLPR